MTHIFVILNLSRFVILSAVKNLSSRYPSKEPSPYDLP
jgi:hypothetical protein